MSFGTQVGMPMLFVHSKSLKDLVHEIVDVTPSSVLPPEMDRYAFQVEAALLRSRANDGNELTTDFEGRARFG